MVCQSVVVVHLLPAGSEELSLSLSCSEGCGSLPPSVKVNGIPLLSASRLFLSPVCRPPSARSLLSHPHCLSCERASWRTARRTASTMDFKRLSLHQSPRHLRVVVLHHRHCQRHSLTPTHGESRAWKSRKEHKRKESTCRKFSERTGRRTHYPVRTSQPHSPR